MLPLPVSCLGAVTTMRVPSSSPIPLYPNGLVHYWKLEEATSAPRINSVSLVNLIDVGSVGVALVTGIHGNGAYSTDGAQLLGSMLTPTSAYTISLWLKPNDLTSLNQSIFANSDTGGFVLRVVEDNSAPRLLFGQYDGGDWQLVTSDTSLTEGEWYHVVLQWTGDVILIYVNGILDCTPVSCSALSQVGGGFSLFYENGNASYDGTIDELGYWERILSTEEITALYNSGTGLFPTFS
jgi:arabinan endo-1,5-alpha-L-arabinosidase